MENTLLEGIKLFMAILGMVIIIYLLIKNMRRCTELLEKEDEIKFLNKRIKEWSKDYGKLYDTMVSDVSELEQKLHNQKIYYENKIDKLEEAINNLEKNKC